jgi:hypothetical protein
MQMDRFAEGDWGITLEVAAMLEAFDEKAHVQIEGAVGGMQIDIVVETGRGRGRKRTIIECKASANLIGKVAVTSFGSVFQFLKIAGEAAQGWMVAASGFTSAASEEAARFGVQLFSLTDFRDRFGAQGRDFRPQVDALRRAEAQPAHGKRRIFVLMPYSPEMIDVYILGISWVADKLGVVAQRADYIQHNGDIIAEIQRSIREYDVVVGDTTGANANVCYEIGFAHALGRPTILICREGEVLPFDLRGVNHVMYPNIVELRKLFLPRLEATLR